MHSLPLATARARGAVSMSAVGSATESMPCEREMRATSWDVSCPIDGQTSVTRGSFIERRSPVRRFTTQASPPSMTTSHSFSGRIVASTGGERRHASTTSRNASTRVSTPASAVWLSSSSVRNGFEP